ncbi:bifunctional 3,4-dihydroxy-2-butanone-4-phosphate synthase/GTP cyclohydrolase II [Candidatus Omnitrophota bacterium]
MSLNTIPEIIKDLSNGKMVIVVDDEGRENEGDLIMAASFVKAEHINFMAKEARGLICVPMEENRLKNLNLQSMAESLVREPVKTGDPYGTAWMMSVDAATGITTGISAYDRARTIEILANPQAKADDLTRPGHVFPLRAVKGGVLVRAGHTEAAIDLMRLAKVFPVGVICEIMNEDGSMARTPELLQFAKKHKLKICTIADLIEYRRRTEKLVKKVTDAKLPTEFGEFRLMFYESEIDTLSHIALVMGNVSSKDPVLVRVHSQCLTGDVFGSMRCDCGLQLKKAMQIIGEKSRGVILYMNQEGRGIGLKHKLCAYNLQDKGMDTVQANEALGFAPDLRDYGIGAQILVDLGVKHIKLMTNNPRKIVGLDGYGLKVVERMPLMVGSTPENKHYLKTKKEKLGHLLNEDTTYE